MIGAHDGPHASPSSMATKSGQPVASPMPDDMGHGSMDASSSGMDMMMSGPDLFPTWVMVAWIVALAAVLIFHCGHLVHMGGQHRWYHLSHVLMLLGMIYMYASMAFMWSWFPNELWMVIFAVSSLAMAGWILIRFVAHRPVSYLWILALIQQIAMIYMWLPMSSWVAWLSYGLTVYFALEAIAWLVGLCDDTRPDRGVAFGPGDKSLVVPLSHGGAWARISMAIMAASMSYMFVGMQIM